MASILWKFHIVLIVFGGVSVILFEPSEGVLDLKFLTAVLSNYKFLSAIFGVKTEQAPVWKSLYSKSKEITVDDPKTKILIRDSKPTVPKINDPNREIPIQHSESMRLKEKLSKQDTKPTEPTVHDPSREIPIQDSKLTVLEANHPNIKIPIRKISKRMVLKPDDPRREIPIQDSKTTVFIADSNGKLSNPKLKGKGFIGTKEDLKVLENAYKNSPDFLTKIKELRGNFSHIRDVAEDGNSFFRSYAFGYFEYLLHHSREIANFQTLVRKIKEELVIRFDKNTVEELHKMFEEVITVTESGNPESLFNILNQPSYSNNVVQYLRFITSAEIRKKEDTYCNYITKDFTFEKFCCEEVEMMDKKSDNIHIMALSTALNINVQIASMNASSSPKLMMLNFSDEIRPSCVHLLFTPGHYSILYIITDETVDDSKGELSKQKLKSKGLIGKKDDVTVLEIAYKNSPNFLRKIKELRRKFSHVRDVAGDGNCFFRAYAFSYFEYLLNHSQEIANFQTLVRKIKEELINRFDKNTVEELHKMFEEVITVTESGHFENLYKIFNQPIYSNNVVRYLRLITSGEMQKDEGFYCHYITDDLTFENFCRKEVEMMNKESDNIHIIALSKALKINVQVASINATPTLKPMIVKLPEENRPCCVHLLYTPGHYSILYSMRDETCN